MKTTELKITRIGNSRGVRLPATVLRRYRIGGVVLMEEKSEGILLRPAGPAVEKLSWEDTAREMAQGAEKWQEWDATAGDGLDTAPWEDDQTLRVAEQPGRYVTHPRKGKPS